MQERAIDVNIISKVRYWSGKMKSAKDDRAKQNAFSNIRDEFDDYGIEWLSDKRRIVMESCNAPTIFETIARICSKGYKVNLGCPDACLSVECMRKRDVRTCLKCYRFMECVDIIHNKVNKALYPSKD